VQFGGRGTRKNNNIPQPVLHRRRQHNCHTGIHIVGLNYDIRNDKKKIERTFNIIMIIIIFEKKYHDNNYNYYSADTLQSVIIIIIIYFFFTNRLLVRIIGKVFLIYIYIYIYTCIRTIYRIHLLIELLNRW